MRALAKSDETLKQKTLLLREVVELLMWELTTITERRWERLAELKEKKTIMAERLKQFDWTQEVTDDEPLELSMLKSQIIDLEYQSQQKVSFQMRVVRQQIDSLRNQRKWLECVNSYMRKSPEMQSAQ
jgi:hypothetical protein